MKTQDTLQVIIFRKVQTDYEFLLLKRIPEKGGFWQPISARIEKDENPLEGARRELKEETGISDTKKVIEVCTFPNGQGEGKDYVFAFEVTQEIEIDLNSNIYPEHDEFKWCNFKDAYEIAKWPQYKEALKKLKEILKK